MAEFEKQFTTLYFGQPVRWNSTPEDYKWIINSTSYASIIPSVGDVVYGSLYFLSDRDEKALDTSEGVPWLYEKQYLEVHRIVDGKMEERTTQSLAYVDVQRLEEGIIEPDYIVWVNKAIRDGLKNGIPKEYVEKYLRRWVGNPEKEQDIMMVRTITGLWAMGEGVQGRVMGSLDRG